MARRFTLIALVIALAYLAIQMMYIIRLPLVMDEFDGAYDAHQLLTRVPYRDFPPYKTVLGYYLQIPPLLLARDPWSGLMLSKAWLALINTICIFVVTVSLAALFSPLAAVASELLLVCVSTFLERSSELRVDMLTAWAGLFSFLLVLKRRWLLAGVLAGASFLVSQKGIYYIISANAAAGAVWLFEQRDRKALRDLAVLNAGVAASILGYLAFWSIVATPSSVIYATFVSPSDVAFRQLYNLSRNWAVTMDKNPVYYGGALAGFLVLIAARVRERAGPTHLMVVAYGVTLLALCRWHRQPWPYFFVILIPTLMVVHAASIDVLLRERIKVVPVLLIVVGVVGGVLYPLTSMGGILARDNRYQAYVVHAAHSLLDRGDTYLAGNDLVYDREQTHPALRRLSAFRVVAMRSWPKSRVDALIDEMDRGHPKLMIFDYRLEGLPTELRSYLLRRFDHWSASVYLYAPLVMPDERTFDIWFDGQYRIEPIGDGAVIDGQRVASGTVVALQRGSHHNGSLVPILVRLIPKSFDARTDPGMKDARPLFAGVYDY
jgi:hypothetical protein